MYNFIFKNVLINFPKQQQILLKLEKIVYLFVDYFLVVTVTFEEELRWPRKLWKAIYRAGV